FGRALPQDVVQAQEELAELARQLPKLAPACAVTNALLPVLFGQPVEGPVPKLTAKQAAAKAAGGVSLLRHAELPLDPAWLRQRWLDVCDAFEGQQKTREQRRLFQKMRPQADEAATLAAAVFAGRPEVVAERARQLDLIPEMSGNLLRLTLLP